jgi:hypothetical protein
MQKLNKITIGKSFSFFMVGLIMLFTFVVTINADDNCRLFDHKNSSQIVKVSDCQKLEIIRSAPDGSINIAPERLQTTSKFDFSSNKSIHYKLTCNIYMGTISKYYQQPDNLSAYFTNRLLL